MARAARDMTKQPAKTVRRSRVRVARTKVGLGVFAERWFAPDEIVGEIEGAIIDDFSYSSRYCMDLGDSRCLEPGPPFRYMNHSCAPNCQFLWYDINEGDSRPPRRRVFVLANYRISHGDELTIDYGWPPHMAIPCRCGAANCRGWIVAQCDLAEVLAAQSAATADCIAVQTPTSAAIGA